MTSCSWARGWRSLLLRGYTDAPNADEFTTAPTEDPVLVLVTKGSCDIEARYRTGWQRAHYEKGHLGMTAAGDPEHFEMSSWLNARDPALEGTLLALARASSAGAPDLYAETAG